MNISEKLVKLLAEHLEVDRSEIKMDAKFKDDLGADSLDIVELVMVFEETFDVEISDSDAEKLLTVGDVIKYLENAKK